jgi:hypothetical protein
LSGIGGDLVHPSAGQSIKAARRTRPFALVLGFRPTEVLRIELA